MIDKCCFFAGPGIYDAETINLWLKPQGSENDVLNKRICRTGMVIGDPLCNNRMFEYGAMELLETALKVRKENAEPVFQTPLYITDRNIKEVQQQVSYLYHRFHIRRFLVQDIGILQWMKMDFEDIYVIWSRLGFGRGALINEPFVRFLKEAGVNGLETNRIELIKALPEYGIDPWPIYGYKVWNSVCRECYSKYVMEQFDGSCERICRDSSKQMLLKRKVEKEKLPDQNSPDNPDTSFFTMSVDGHYLGEKYLYSKNQEYLRAAAQSGQPIMIYGKNISEVILHEVEFIRNSISSS